MATYAIGDIQGCYAPLDRMLELIAFDAAVDRLWIVGDLVNRGPESLRVLRFLRGLGDAASIVLGNHDLYLLMVAAGYKRRDSDDTLFQVLEADDRDELLEWLKEAPFEDDNVDLTGAGIRRFTLSPVPVQATLRQAMDTMRTQATEAVGVYDRSPNTGKQILHGVLTLESIEKFTLASMLN